MKAAPARPLPGPALILARSAAILALGNLASRLLGLLREMVIADYFGASAEVSAFQIAAFVPKNVYELLVGGMISAALVPVLSEVRAREGEEGFWRAASALVSLTAVLFGLALLLLQLAAPLVAWLLGGGFSADLRALASGLIRAILPSLLFFGLSGVLTGVLFARERFAYPAMGAALFNLGVILAALALAPRLGILSLSLGVVLGAGLQLGILLPGLRGGRLRWRWQPGHPALVKMLRLYLPVVGSIVVAQVGLAIDRNLASRVGEQVIAWMQFATTLIQFPLGLVSVAVSTAVLPTLATLSSRGAEADFKRSLGLGLRLVLVLTLPATLGLLALGLPIIRLLFEHGSFLPPDSAQTYLALSLYLVGLPFAAVDLLLVFAFYARQDTLTPVLVGLIGVAVYLAVALSLVGRLGMAALVLANSAQWVGHALIMLLLLNRRLGWLSGERLGATLLRSALASVAMAVLVYRLAGLLQPRGELLQVILAGGAGLALYALAATLLGLEEFRLAWRLGRGRLTAGVAGRSPGDVVR